ncbi:hypothetical protein CC80DRAFT_40187 [Byssothecium circinans]|uniref:Glycosyl transferase CAP10 domain-containing protein n=1 Tax=Byssothecium circinans TaxID=147558 RepID=A0A6A5U290_9PLEO|nr:hypothetical protein CC80DRAFT_40187 [Byssothecium circinans]
MMQNRILTPRHIVRVVVVFVILTVITQLWYYGPPHILSQLDKGKAAEAVIGSHPIDYLIHEAKKTQKELLAKRTHDLGTTAEAYRKRRGRHPPPGFDKWFEYAKAHNAVIVEDFFDQIYHDLTPFGGLPAKQIRQHAKQLPFKISIRNKEMLEFQDDKNWMPIWHDMVKEIKDFLPDLDMPMNVMDEPRLIAPWEDINKYVQKEHESRTIVPTHNVIKELSPLDVDKDEGEKVEIEFISQGAYWDTARVACAPDSPSRSVPAATNFTGSPPYCKGEPGEQCSPDASIWLSYKGYVSNWTAVKDPCLQPELRETHGSFIEPLSQSTTRSLVPLFGGSKLPMNNDILIPPAMYWAKESLYATGDTHGAGWEQKQSRLAWRGGATGGKHHKDNFSRFQRLRFIALMNGTQVRQAQLAAEAESPSFKLQPYQDYLGTAGQHMDLGAWLDKIADVGFTDLLCSIKHEDKDDRSCPYLDPYFQLVKGIPLEKMYDFKYLPDIDGNSFSGRYLTFLRSASLPIKATVYSEWHDSRLVPWAHFVPMHNSFVDIYGILKYFIGSTKITAKGKLVTENGHDKEAKELALAGQDWANKVLRSEDMLIYVMRLLLEFARICDDKRDSLGFVGDLA